MSHMCLLVTVYPFLFWDVRLFPSVGWSVGWYVDWSVGSPQESSRLVGVLLTFHWIKLWFFSFFLSFISLFHFSRPLFCSLSSPLFFLSSWQYQDRRAPDWVSKVRVLADTPDIPLDAHKPMMPWSIEPWSMVLSSITPWSILPWSIVLWFIVPWFIVPFP
jgi:hypothetical protein